MRSAQSETVIQRAILDWLIWHRIFAWREARIPTPIRRGNQIVGLRRADPHTLGIPDILACVRGRMIGIEVKTKIGKQSLEQIAWQDRIEKAGGLYLLARSVNDVEDFFKKHNFDELKI